MSAVTSPRAEQLAPISGVDRSPAGSAAIVVGLDGRQRRPAALDWAVAEALHDGRSLQLLKATEVRDRTTPGVVAPVVWEAPDEVLEAARVAVSQRAPQLRTTVVQTSERACDALVRAGRHAHLIVLGNSRHSRASAAIFGSTAISVAARATCPVVVVPGPVGHGRARLVVVGVDDDGTCAAALAFAAQWAVAHRCDLRVLHAWSGDVSIDIMRAPEADRREARALASQAQRADLSTLLAPVRATYPSLTIEVRVPTGDPVAMLGDSSRDARLLVVGSRGLRAWSGWWHRSVSQGLVEHTGCPMAVVREPHLTSP